MEKDTLRRETLKKLKSLPDKKEASSVIVSRILDNEKYRSADTVLAFFPLLSTEPDIFPLLNDERVLLPFIENGEMKFGRGKPEKSPLGVTLLTDAVEADYESAVILVPLVAFDSTRLRLGRGGGYYDRYIKEHRGKLHSIGVAFSASYVENIPRDSWDEKLDEIITEKSPGQCSGEEVLC